MKIFFPLDLVLSLIYIIQTHRINQSCQHISFLFPPAVFMSELINAAHWSLKFGGEFAQSQFQYPGNLLRLSNAASSERTCPCRQPHSCIISRHTCPDECTWHPGHRFQKLCLHPGVVSCCSRMCNNLIYYCSGLCMKASNLAA